MIWQLNKIQYPVYNLGPGKRLGIWVQGCSLQCPGCINPSTWDPKRGKEVMVQDVLMLTELLSDGYEGVTITGGEPFEQYVQLMAYAGMLKKRTKLSVLCYSGYRLEELEEKFPDKAYTQYLDILIDGHYEKGFPAKSPVTGSGNQQIYTFKNKKAVKTSIETIVKKWSLRCEDNTIYMAGIPAQKEMEKIESDMNGSGFRIRII